MKQIIYVFMMLFICVISSVLAMDAPVTTQHTLSPHSTGRLWNLQNADILSIINQVSLETGKNFVVDPRVSGKISLVSSKPVKPQELYDIFLSILELLGYSAIPSGHIIKIVPNMEGGEFATPVANSRHPGRPDDIVVRIVSLERVSAQQLIPVVRPLLPQWSNISAYIPGNTLILIGRSANLQRILRIIHQIDENAAFNIDVVPLHQASATQLATILSNLQNVSRSQGETPQVSIAADERSNSILLSGNKSSRLHLRYLINQLDVPAGKAEGNTEVIYLKYLQAKTFAPLLGKIAQNMQGKNGSAHTEIDTSNSSSTASHSITKSLNTNVQAELSTNAIIITAPPAMMRALKNVVSKLDIRPAEVLVEGIIVQLDQNDLRNLGIQWGTLTNTTSTDINGNPINTSTLAQGMVGIIPHASISAILQILETRNDANILSTPSVSVLDNHKAKLEIGQTVPSESGSYATTGNANTATPFNTFQDKKVALTLDVLPQINLNTAVRLDIKLTNDSLQNPENPGNHPIINTSTIQNSVIVNSGDILVLGGLMSSSSTETVHKIPLLGDLPIIGKTLFQQKGHQIQKKNLLVFIKPTILHNMNDATFISANKYNYIRQRQLQWPENIVANTRDKAPNVLPLWKNSTQLPRPFSQNPNKLP